MIGIFVSLLFVAFLYWFWIGGYRARLEGQWVSLVVDLIVPIDEEKQIGVLMADGDLQAFGHMSVLNLSPIMHRDVIANRDSGEWIRCLTESLYPPEAGR